MAELESIVASMETGDLSLAASLAAYRRGAELLQYCQSALKDAEQQVQVLERGVLQPFIADTASSAESDDEP
jgi:exodeoxyribonuclease VII small subunit